MITFTPTLPQGEGTTVLGSNGLEYQICDGCPVLKTAVDIDTVDGHSLPGVAPAGVVDSATGEPIAEGASVIVFFDASGSISGYKDCTDDNDYGVLLTATTSFTDTAGNIVAADDKYLFLPDGSTSCQSKTIDTDTFAGLIFAGGSGTDDAGNDYISGSPLLQLANGDLICQQKTIDTVGSVTANQAGQGGGVGTASINFPATSLTPATQKDNAVCGVQSSTSVNAATGLQETILNDSSVLVSCPDPVKDIRPDPATGEMVAYAVDPITGDEYEVERWFNAAPENRTKIQIVATDGEVIDGNGDSVAATSLGGEAIEVGGYVAVECDPDGNVVRVKVFAIDTTLGSETPNGDALPFNSTTNNHIITQCCTWTSLVDEDGNVTNPHTGEVSASGLPVGTLATSHSDENGLGATSCPAGSYKSELLCNTPNEGLMTFRTTDLKTGLLSDVAFTADKVSYSPPQVASFNFIDPIITEAVGIANWTPITEEIEFEVFCTQKVDIEFELHLNADANPAGIPGESINFGAVLNGAITPLSMLISFSPASLGVLGATESVLGNQEMPVSAKICRDLPVGVHKLQLVTWLSNAPDEGEGIQYQGIKFTVSHNTLKCC